ncbi:MULTISPECIES: LysR family transcriptional regulator [unclassified Kitasatospora]|uniref:LysR substrate-binding domain-containing protein n=1 Tax=unclassified Kitasatospora TaxID=2633591 RepID=UPI00070DFF10|nr:MULTISPECIES: LysR family transcriptional regulator [unclassified Kitasatospora]KQV23899.1 LysR family transcriptional regulator [Kitasatospora sp. Root107]KRB67389.1 LysR family transcriptional regulator [Kitasatospora sp. Root187]
MVTLRQLEYLVAIVDQGSFTRAAELLHVTQPALSHQIRVLERQLGGPLLERLPRLIRLTPAGRAMLPHARAALAETRRAEQAARRTAGSVSGEVELATLYGYSLGLLPTVLRAWRRVRPDIGVRLFEHRHADELRDAMAAGQADLALGPPPPDWAGPVHPIGEEEFVVVVAADDPAATVPFRLSSLADRAWVHYAPGNGLAELLDQACAAAGFQSRTAVRTEQTAAAPLLAAAGLGPTLAAAHVLPPGFDGRLLRPDPPIRRRLAVWTRTDPDPLTAAFRTVLTREAAAHLNSGLPSEA